jgi:hypothetical protein
MLVPAGTYDAHCCVLPEGVVEKSSSQQLGIGVQYWLVMLATWPASCLLPPNPKLVTLAAAWGTKQRAALLISATTLTATVNVITVTITIPPKLPQYQSRPRDPTSMSQLGPVGLQTWRPISHCLPRAPLSLPHYSPPPSSLMTPSLCPSPLPPQRENT